MPPEPLPVAGLAAIKPDREKALLGCYVHFIKEVKRPKLRIPKKSKGIIVTDTKGKCRQDQLAVRLFGMKFGNYVVARRDEVRIARAESR